MNKKNLPSKPTPYFPAYTKIFSKHSYNKFLKSRPKYLQKFEIERYDSISDDLKSLRSLGIHIKHLTKSIKNVQHLSFVEFPHRFIPMNIHKDMIKRFLRVRKLSQFWMQESSKLILLNYLYLKKLKGLENLALDESDGESFVFTDPTNLERITSKFLRFLQRIKLQKLEFKLNGNNAPYYGLLNFPRYPASLRAWSLSYGETQSIEKVHQFFNLNLNHLWDLEKLQILTSLSLGLLNQVLGSILKSERLKILAFKVTDKESFIENFLPTTRTLLSKFSKLEHFAFHSETWLDLFSLSDSPYWRLRSLGVEIQTFRKEDLKNLKELLGQQQASLEGLNLKLCFEEQPEAFLEEMCDFIRSIGDFERLKVLRITFTVKVKMNDENITFPETPISEEEINPLPILPFVTEAISRLKGLKELGISYIGADFSKDFGGFFKALEQRSHILEVLEIGLNAYKIQKRDLETLGRVLIQCKSLEFLKLKSLVIGEKGFFKYFAKTIHRCLNLRSLVLSGIKVDLSDYNPQEMIDMLEDIFRKRNLTHIYLRNSDGDSGAFDSCEKLKLSKIYQEYPHIQTLIAPIYTNDYVFPRI